MPRVLVLLLLAVRVAAAQPADRDDADPPEHEAPAAATAPRGVQLMHAGTSWHYQVMTAPPLAPQIGALAASGLDVAAGRAKTPIAVLGDEHPAPDAWPYGVDGSLHAAGAIRPAAPPASRIAALYAVTTFTLGSEHQGLRVLEVRLKFRDGCAVWLNGVEVARRALPAGSMALAQRPHGPEWEMFAVAVAPTLLRLGDNVLAVEVHPSGSRDAPELEAEIYGRRDLGIVRGPVLADVGPTSATIVVDTDPGADATLEWGAHDALDHQVASPAGATHTFALTGLPAHAQVSYRVRAGAAQTARLAFHTAPSAGDVVRIGVYGDVRGGHDTHRRLVDAMLGDALDLVAVTGDMVLRGTDAGDWQKFFAVTRELLATVRYVASVGNHDLGLGSSAFALPPAPSDRPADAYWYSFELADVHLVFLDSNAYERPEQETWLAADLAAARARKVRAILAFTHDGPYSRGLHRGNRLARERYVPILAREHVDLLLAGHDHLYMRGEAGGLRYLVSGGGGAGLYQPTCGVEGKPKCIDDGMQKLAIEHHYVTLTVDRSSIEMCARHGDGTLVEPCVHYVLWRP